MSFQGQRDRPCWVCGESFEEHIYAEGVDHSGKTIFDRLCRAKVTQAMTQPMTPETEKEYREANDFEDINVWQMRDDLLAEIDRLRAENDDTIKQLSNSYQELRHDFAVMCGHYNDALRERDQLREKLCINEEQYSKTIEHYREKLIERDKTNTQLTTKLVQLSDKLAVAVECLEHASEYVLQPLNHLGDIEGHKTQLDHAKHFIFQTDAFITTALAKIRGEG